MGGYGGREERGESISLLNLIRVYANETRCAEQTSETVNNWFRPVDPHQCNLCLDLCIHHRIS